MRQIDTLFIHCAATRPDWMQGESVEAKKAEIDRWHRDRGFDGFGYHYLIDRDGKVAQGRPLSRAGAHVRGHNAKSIGICLVGGFGSDAGDKFAKNYTPAQEMALRALIDTMQDEFPNTRVRGHNEVANKACPGFNVQEWIGGKSAVVAQSAIKVSDRTSPAQSTTLRAAGAQIGTTLLAGGPVIGALDGTAQIVAIAMVGMVVLSAIWIFRERLRKWHDGDR
jgi:N-acetylmuramoyl-L-alanine amidase